MTSVRHRWPAIALIVLCAAYAVAALSIRPSIGVDPAYSLRIYQSMQAGAPWNHLIEPDVDDLSRDRLNFGAIFSPGPYLVPSLVMAAGTSMGSAVTLVSLVVTFAGLYGWYRFYVLLEFEPWVAWVTCLLLAASRSVNYAFVIYLGGEILAFAAFPFLAAELYRRRDSRWLPIYAALAVVIAFTAKNSLAIYVTGWLGAQAVIAIAQRREHPRRIAPAVLAVVAAVGVMAVIHVEYVMRGWSPLSYQPAIARIVRPYIVPWALPALAATSWDDLFSWVFLHPSGAIVPFDYRNSVAFLAVCAMLTVTAAAITVWRHSNPHVAQIFLYSVITVGGLMTLLASGAVASLDLARHYRVIGYCWLPFMVQAVATSRPLISVTLAGALALPGVYGVGSLASNWRRHYVARSSQSERLRITHTQLTPRMTRALAVLDHDLPTASLVVTPVPTYALEFIRTRALATNIVADEIRQVHVYHGRAENLVVIADRRGMTPEKQAAWLATFADYRQWTSFDVDDHRFYLPKEQAISPEWLEARIQ